MISTSQADRPETTRAPIRSYALLLVVAAFVLLIDQVSKNLVTQDLAERGPVKIFGGLVRVDYTRNSGAAFGILRTHGIVFMIVAIVVSAGIILYYRRIARSSWLVHAALGLVLGGALGNLLDRLRLGYVVDFIDLRWWPVFNLADSAVVVGVVALLVFAFASDSKRP